YPEIHPPSQEISDEVFQANHSVQNEESFKNSSDEIAASNSNQEKEEPPQDSDIHQLIEECSTEICEEQKQKPEHSLSMGYEHLSITPETESKEVTESNAQNLLPISSECEVTSEDEKEIDLEDISQIQDDVLREKLLSINRLLSNIKSLNDNPTHDRVLNSFESDNSLSNNFSPEFETFCDYTKETRSGNTTHADN
nr:hypothetical protein [Tanacetum cinerariifolium]